LNFLIPYVIIKVDTPIKYIIRLTGGKKTNMKTKLNIAFLFALVLGLLLGLASSAYAFDMNEGDEKTISLNPEMSTKMTYWNKDMWKTSRLDFKIFVGGKEVSKDTLYISAGDGDKLTFNPGHDKIHVKCTKGKVTVFISQ